MTPNSDGLGYATFDWSKDSLGNRYAYEDKNYFIYSSGDGVKYNKIGIDYESVAEVKCLQIYPNIPQLRNWVVNSGYGKGKIKVDEVYFDNFNRNPEAYLKKDSNGNWNYDVIYVGTWDRNNCWDFSARSYAVVDKFVKAGKGCIFGHDTIFDNSFTALDNRESAGGTVKYDHEYMNKIASDYFKALYRKSTSTAIAPSYNDTTIRIVKQGLFTTYPNYVGGIGTILHIPSCHTWGQGVTPGYEGNIWLKFGTDNNDQDNYYMITDNNMAMFQTGHSNGASTADEQKIIANLLFYCNQLLSNSYKTRDMASQDTKAPGKVEVEEINGNYRLSADDYGNAYKYYIEAYKKEDTTASGLLETSDIVQCEVKTYVRGYKYILNKSANTVVTVNNSEMLDGVEENGVTAGDGDLVGYIDIETIQDYDYMHVAAIDGAGNLGETIHIKIKHNADYELEYNLEKLNGDFNIKDWENYELRETKKYNGKILDKIPKDGDVKYYAGFICIDNGNKDGKAYIKANDLAKLVLWYRRIRYNIVYSPGESFATGETQSQNIKWGEEFKIRENGFTKEYTYNLDLNGGRLPEDITDTKLIEKHTFKNWHYNSGDIDGRIDSGDYIENQVISSEEQHFTVNDADNITLEAVWEPGKIKLPNVTKDGADFIGWFNVPQEMGNTGVKAKLLGKANEEVTLEDLDRKGIQDLDANNEFTLYAWFNKRPVFVNLYDGLFFEGQDVDYKDLLELVGVWDYDDNYEDIASDKVNEHFNSLKEIVDNDIEDVRDDIYYIEEADRESGDDYTSELKELRERLAKLFTERQKIESTRRELLKGIKIRKLEPVIANIKYIDGESEFDYHSDEVSSNGLKIVTSSNAELKLDTKTENIGRVEITYQVHDEGIYYKDWTHVDDLETSEEDEEISEENLVFVEGSKITMEYTRKCQINFNYNPLLNLQNMLYYTDYDFGDSLSDFVMSRQIVRDSEDLQDNIPWWSKKADTKNLLLHKENENTIDKLQKTLVITSVGDEISFNTVFENEFKGATEKFRDEIKQNEVYSEKELLDYMYSFKNDPEVYWKDGESEVKKSDIWDNLTSISITFDGCDQFGKCASNNVSEYGIQKGVKTDIRPKGYKEEFNSGYKVSDDMIEYDISIYQTDYERTVYLMLINLNNDSDLSHVRVKDRIRYISKDYLDTLEGSFWGTEGLVEIEKALGKAEVPGDSYTDRAGSYNDIKVNIKDYTE